jgi:hypothetical protein
VALSWWPCPWSQLPVSPHYTAAIRTRAVSWLSLSRRRHLTTAGAEACGDAQ